MFDDTLMGSRTADNPEAIQLTGNHTQKDIRHGFALFCALGCVVASLLLVAWLFRATITDLVYSEAAQGFDAATMRTMQSSVGPAVHGFFFRFTALGSPIAMWILCVAGLAWLVPRARPIVIAAWIAAFGGASALSTGLKHIIVRERPPGAAEFLFSMSYSFPSTHALASLVGYGMVTWVICQYRVPEPARRLLVRLMAATLVATIAASRLILGVHFATDVLAGLALGAIWLTVCIVLLDRTLRATQPNTSHGLPTS